MIEIVWEEPSFEAAPRGPRSSKWKAVADALREHEEKWARLRDFEKRPAAYSLSSSIRRGRAVAWAPEGDFEARVEKVGENLWAVYARFIGNDKA